MVFTRLPFTLASKKKNDPLSLIASLPSCSSTSFLNSITTFSTSFLRSSSFFAIGLHLLSSRRLPRLTALCAMCRFSTSSSDFLSWLGVLHTSVICGFLSLYWNLYWKVYFGTSPDRSFRFGTGSWVWRWWTLVQASSDPYTHGLALWSSGGCILDSCRSR